jgi:hypothetical protein
MQGKAVSHGKIKYRRFMLVTHKKKGRDGSFKGLKKEWWVYCIKLSTFLLFKYSLQEKYEEQGKLWHLLLWRSVLD